MSTNFESASLYVGDLAVDINEALLFDLFNAVGPVASIRVCRDAVTGRSLGYAYVNFHHSQDAQRAFKSLNFTQIGSRPCRIMWSQRDPALRRSGVGNIFVKNLDPSIDHKALFDTFSTFGSILSCKVVMDERGASLGYGFVHYDTHEAAQKAIVNVNGMLIAGQSVLVEPFKPRAERSDNSPQFTNIYVKNIPEDIKEDEFKEMFGKFGAITSCVYAYDNEQKFRGFGFVNYSNPDEAKQAVDEMNDFQWNEKRLFCGRAMRKKEREQLLQHQRAEERSRRYKEWNGCNLFVKNLADEVTEEELAEKFKPFGTITSCRLMKDGSGRTRGFGFVCFSTPEEAQLAIQEMNGAIIAQKPLFVALFQTKEARRAQMEVFHRRQKVPAGPPMFPQPLYYPSGPGMYLPQSQHKVPRPQRVFSQQPPQNNPPYSKRGTAGRSSPPVPGRAMGAKRQQGNVPAISQHAELTLQALAVATPQEQRQMIGERLFARIVAFEPTRAGKITGMLLEMDSSDVLDLLEDDSALRDKVEEAVSVLERHAANNSG